MNGARRSFLPSYPDEWLCCRQRSKDQCFQDLVAAIATDPKDKPIHTTAIRTSSHIQQFVFIKIPFLGYSLDLLQQLVINSNHYFSFQDSDCANRALKIWHFIIGTETRKRFGERLHPSQCVFTIFLETVALIEVGSNCLVFAVGCWAAQTFFKSQYSVSFYWRRFFYSIPHARNGYIVQSGIGMQGGPPVLAMLYEVTFLKLSVMSQKQYHVDCFLLGRYKKDLLHTVYLKQWFL